MKVTAATKEETLALEETTESLNNFLNKDRYNKPSLFRSLRYLHYLSLMSDIVSWYHFQGLKATPMNSLWEHVHKFSGLIGYAPTYHAVRGSGAYRNAIWGFHFEHENHPFGVVLYMSTRGLTVQAQGLTPKSHRALLSWLKERVLPAGFKSTRDWFRKHPTQD